MSSLLHVPLAVPWLLGGAGQLSFRRCTPNVVASCEERGVGGAQGVLDHCKETPYFLFSSL